MQIRYDLIKEKIGEYDSFKEMSLFIQTDFSFNRLLTRLIQLSIKNLDLIPRFVAILP